MKEIMNRRSVRKFQEREVEPEKIEMLLKAAMQAPSAGNQQPWEFIVVREKEALVQLSQMGPYSKAIAEAPVAIVLLGNEERMNFKENWQQDLGAAAENILIEAVAQDLGAVWLGAAPLEERMSAIRAQFDLPETIHPYCVIPVGYAAGRQQEPVAERYDSSRVHYEKY